MKITLWIIVAILVMLLAGLGWYAFTLMGENEELSNAATTMNDAMQEPTCTSLNASGISAIITSSNDGSTELYCVTGDDLSVAYMEEKKAIENSQGLLAAMSTSTDSVKECIVAKQFINESAANTNICDGVDPVAKWPDVVSFDAQWGGCEFGIDKEAQTFVYCAQMTNGTAMTCTQDGCKESDMMAAVHEEIMPMVDEENVDPGLAPEPTLDNETTEDPIEADDTPPLL